MKALKLLPILIWVLGASFGAQAQSELKKGCSQLKRTLYVDDRACTNDSVQFDAGSFATASYSWDFNGDGIFEVVKSDVSTLKHNYVSAGNYNPYVVIYTDSCTEGVRNFTASGLQVENIVLPKFDIEQNCDEISLKRLPSTLEPDSITWNLVETIVSGNNNPTHKFTSDNGDYVVSLTTYYNGCVAEESEIVTIQRVEANPVVELSSQCAPATVELKNKEQYSKATYEWMLDGKKVSNNGTYSFKVNQAQNFDLGFSVKNEYGCYDAVENVNAIEIGAEVKAIAYLEEDAICSGDEIKLAENHSGNNFRKVIWGDGAIDTINRAVKHQYNKAGEYTVTVIAANSKRACADTLVLDQKLTVFDTPQADFSFELEGTCIPQVLEVNNATQGLYDNYSLVLNNYDTLDFNDIEVIAEPGVHEVRLVVSNTQAGCSTEKIATFKLNAPFNQNLKLDILDAKLNDQDFELSWKGVKNVDHYEIYTVAEENTLFTTVSDTQFTINNYLLDSQFANYAVKAIDQCGSASALSETASAISLNGIYQTDSFPTLQWKPFAAWGENLDHYKIERKEDDGIWIAVAETHLPHYIDRDFNNNRTLVAEYKVTAVHNNGLQESISTNYRFEFEPSIYIPTAFSPNYDNINDQLTIKGHGMERVDIQIFNSWGQRVFNSQGENIAWDGSYKGEIVPEGTYICVVEMETPEGRVYNFNNTITLKYDFQ
ncbi:MAG: gliding motility-associated C-terminal domain-containing protein [Bacteroidia bacterium]